MILKTFPVSECEWDRTYLRMCMGPFHSTNSLALFSDAETTYAQANLNRNVDAEEMGLLHVLRYWSSQICS